MPTTSDLKKGMRIELDGDPYSVLEVATQSPSARGGATLVKVKLRNIRTKQFTQKTFKAGERIMVPNFEIRPCQYLYAEGGNVHVFMDQQNYEQFSMNGDDIEYELGFIRENDEVRVLLHDGQAIGLEIAPTVVLEVTECDPGVRGDTVTGATKNAKLETGIEVQVPLFIEVGEKLMIDTRECRYLRRSN